MAHPMLLWGGNQLKELSGNATVKYQDTLWKVLYKIRDPIVECPTCIHLYRHTIGSHPLWQYPLSFPVADGADTFYNNLVGESNTYTPPSDVEGNGGWSGKSYIMLSSEI